MYHLRIVELGRVLLFYGPYIPRETPADSIAPLWRHLVKTEMLISSKAAMSESCNLPVW